MTTPKRPHPSGRKPKQTGRQLASDGLRVWDMVTLTAPLIAR
ncbi:hypothetical protein ACIA5C_47040 [Actinoplanes sp. NPDC051343]